MMFVEDEKKEKTKKKKELNPVFTVKLGFKELFGHHKKVP